MFGPIAVIARSFQTGVYDVAGPGQRGQLQFSMPNGSAGTGDDHACALVMLRSKMTP